MVALVWFRRDLRVHDHPALCAAVAGHGQIVPVFCLDDRLLHGRHASGPRTAFLLDCLTDLDEQLTARGARLVIRHGPPERELPALAQATGATEVHLSADPSPFEAVRGRRVRAALESAGVTGHAHPGVSVVDDVRAILTGQGRPYTVFTPFHRNWQGVRRRPVLTAPGPLSMPARIRHGRVPQLASLGLRQEVAEPAPGGETAGLARLAAFLDGPVRDYDSGRDQAGADGSSRLSPYLRFGSSGSILMAGMSGVTCPNWPGCQTATWPSRGGCRWPSSSGRAAGSARTTRRRSSSTRRPGWPHWTGTGPRRLPADDQHVAHDQAHHDVAAGGQTG